MTHHADWKTTVKIALRLRAIEHLDLCDGKAFRFGDVTDPTSGDVRFLVDGYAHSDVIISKDLETGLLCEKKIQLSHARFGEPIPDRYEEWLRIGLDSSQATFAIVITEDEFDVIEKCREESRKQYIEYM